MANFEIRQEDVVIAVMGPTGAGKSSFVRAATGDNSVDVGHTLQSVTQSISAHRLQVDSRVVLLDTPAFDNTYKSDAEILKEIALWLAESYSGGHQLTAILYLQRISDARLGGSALRNLALFEKLIGDGALKNVVFVTTMWSSVDHALGLGREMELLENPRFFGAMMERGANTARFDGTTDGAYNIIRSVSTKTTFPLAIQQEIIDKNLPLAETEAGKQVLASVTELQLRYKREISELPSEMSNAIMQNDNSFAKAVAEMSKEYEDKLASAQVQINVLQSRNPEIEALQIRHEQEMNNLRDSESGKAADTGKDGEGLDTAGDDGEGDGTTGDASQPERGEALKEMGEAAAEPVRLERSELLVSSSTPTSLLLNPTEEKTPIEEKVLTEQIVARLYSIVTEQIRQPDRTSNYVNHILDITKNVSENRHELTRQEGRVFALLYQAFFDARASNDTATAGAHLTAAKIIAKRLALESELEMDRTFGPEPHLYAVSVGSMSRTVVSQFLQDIRDVLKANKHPNSFGSIFDVGISTNTRVMFCVFGSKSPDKFNVDPELRYEGISIPVVVVEDAITDAALDPTRLPNWQKNIRDATVDLCGYSVGHEGVVSDAGSFGFYGVHQGEIYGFTAAHCTPGAGPECVIVSPSTVELSGRLQYIAPYTSFNPGPPMHHSPSKQREVERLLKKYRREDSSPGCDIILEPGGPPREIKLLGQQLGTVKAISATNKKLGVIEKHNQRLQELQVQFLLPIDHRDFEQAIQNNTTLSRVEWCCFEVLNYRCAGNWYSSGKYEGRRIRNSLLLAPYMSVFKYGRTTDETEGQVNPCVVQRWMDDDVTVEIGVLGERFADRGDSGSLVITERTPGGGDEGLYALGLLIGKNGGGELALVTPLWAILEDVKDHGLEISLLVD